MNKKKILILLFVFFIIFEIILVINRVIILNKKPEFIKSWHRIDSGLTSIVVYSDYLYVIDNTKGQIIQYEKNTGNNLYTFNFIEGVFGIAHSKDNRLFILHKNNSLSIFSKDYKLISRINLGDNKFSFMGIDIDSKDNIYILERQNNKIIKFNSNMEKINEFYCIDTEKICDICYLSKIIIDSKDNIYYFQNINDHQALIKIFDENGNFKKRIKIRHINKFSNLENIAIGPDGDIYMNNFNEKQVAVYDASGRYKSAFYTDNKKQIMLEYPGSICSDRNEDAFYVATKNILKFKYIKY